LAHLGYAASTSTFADYYHTVDEYVARSAVSPARVGGQVVPGSIVWDNSSQTMHFQIAGESARIDVVYHGPVPDSFRDSTTAILEGSRGPNGSFVATDVMIECPHQYLPGS
jgi:cytochrome c-type biogenesis protein CcmE